MIYKLIRDDRVDLVVEEAIIIKKMMAKGSLCQLKKRLKELTEDHIVMGKYKICKEKVGDVLREGEVRYTKDGYLHVYKVHTGKFPIEFSNLISFFRSDNF